MIQSINIEYLINNTSYKDINNLINNFEENKTIIDFRKKHNLSLRKLRRMLIEYQAKIRSEI